MDSVLLGVHRSEHPPALKAALTRHLVQKSAHLAVSEPDCRRILAAGVAIVQEAPTDALADAGALVVREWGNHNGAVLSRCALPVILEPLLSGPLPLRTGAGASLLSWLLERQPALLATARSLLAAHAAHPGHSAETLAALAGLMLDRPDCRPRFEDAVTLSQGLIRTIAALRMPDQSGQIGAFVTQMERVGQLFQQLFASTQTVVRAMDTLYDVMTNTGDAPVCPALSVALQAVPVKLVTPACSQLTSMKSGGANTTCAGISLLCDWLLVWPRAHRLAVWAAALVREAAAAGHTADLRRLVLARVDKLFQGLALPAVRRSVFPVVSLMLLGFQHSPAAFFKVLPRVPGLLDQLRQESADKHDSGDFGATADLVQTLMRLHPSCVQRYAAVVRALQGRPPPPPSVMASLLVSSAWVEPSARPEAALDESVVLSDAGATVLGLPGQRRRGLVNLGNTCYMNAVLQALFHSDQLCSEVLAARPSPSRPHLAALQRVFAFLAFSERPAYSPAEFQRAALPPWFERGRQHDCSEFLRYLLDAIHEEERSPMPAAAPPPPILPAPATATAATVVTTVRARDDTSVPAAGATERPRPRRRHRSCDTPSTADGTPPAPLVGLPSDDVVMAEPVAGPERPAAGAVNDTGDERTEPDGQPGPGALSASAVPERGIGDGEETPTPAEPAAGLVRRLLTGRAETTYTCLTCGAVSRHVDGVTDLHLALPEALTRPLTVAAAVVGGDSADAGPVFGPEPRPAGWEGTPPDAAESTPMQVDGPVDAPSADQERVVNGEESHRRTSGEGQEQECGVARGAGDSVDTQLTNGDPVASVSAERQNGPEPAPGSSQETAPVFGPEPAPATTPEPAGPVASPEPEPVFGPEPASVFGPEPAPMSEETPDTQTEIDLTVSDLLRDYLAPERLCGDNQYHCTKCAGLRDAERQLRLLAPPPHLVVSLVRFVFDRRTGARRKVLAPVGLTERLTVPLAGRPAVQYRLYAVIVHAGHSLDAGHYFSFCRASGGGAGWADDDGWWRLDDCSAMPVTAEAALGRSRRSTEAAYTLLYRLEERPAAAHPLLPPVMSALPGPLRAAVDRDNAVYRRERSGRPSGALPLIHDGRPPPGAGCGGDSGHPGPGFVC